MVEIPLMYCYWISYRSMCCSNITIPSSNRIANRSAMRQAVSSFSPYRNVSRLVIVDSIKVNPDYEFFILACIT